MSDEEIAQRVKYLTEFGGLFEAARDEAQLLRWVRIGVVVTTAVLVLLILHEAWHWVR